VGGYPLCGARVCAHRTSSLAVGSCFRNLGVPAVDRFDHAAPAIMDESLFGTLTDSFCWAHLLQPLSMVGTLFGSKRFASARQFRTHTLLCWCAAFGCAIASYYLMEAAYQVRSQGGTEVRSGRVGEESRSRFRGYGRGIMASSVLFVALPGTPSLESSKKTWIGSGNVESLALYGRGTAVE